MSAWQVLTSRADQDPLRHGHLHCMLCIRHPLSWQRLCIGDLYTRTRTLLLKLTSVDACTTSV